MKSISWKKTKMLITIISISLLSFEAYQTVKEIRRTRPIVRETLKHSDDKVSYYLSKVTNHDDSLYLILYNQAIDSAHTFEPSFHSFLYGLTESRDIQKQVLCDVFLAHATTLEDSVFVKQTMLPPYNYSSEYGFRKELGQRVSAVKSYLKIE